MLQKFYANQAEYSFAFQMMAYISRLALLKEAVEANPNAVIITERCLKTDYNVFAKMLHEQGTLLDEEYAIYTNWFNAFSKESEISAIVYVYCHPEVSYERCKKRQRTGENIPLEYLTRCHEKHEQWIHQETMNKLIQDNNTAELDDVLFSIHAFISSMLKK
jgi:deoxyadenosine/deoxycytidine kinase